MRKQKRIGILTGGGDCAGLNAVIRAVFRTAHNMGWEVLGIEESFGGLLDMKKTKLLKPRDVRGILHTGGTILGASKSGPSLSVSGENSVGCHLPGPLQ